MEMVDHWLETETRELVWPNVDPGFTGWEVARDILFHRTDWI